MNLIPRQKKIPGFRESKTPDTISANRLLKLRPYVRQTGNDWRSPWHLESRKLLDYLLVFIGTGSGVFTVGNDSFAVDADDLIWIPPDTVHDMRGLSSNMNCIYIHFDLEYTPERSLWDACIPGGTLDLSEFKNLLHPPSRDPVFSKLSGKLNTTAPGRIRKLMENICRIHEFKGGKTAFELSTMLQQLLLEIENQLNAGTTAISFHYKKLHAAAEYISQNVFKDFTIKQLAQRCSLSEAHFRKLFRESYGVSPQKMRQQSRIRKGCELLVYTSKPVSEIAHQLCYSSIYSFSRAFKNAMNISPQQYRTGKLSG